MNQRRGRSRVPGTAHSRRTLSRRTFLRGAGKALAAAGMAELISTPFADAGISRVSQAGYDQSLRPQFHFTARTGWMNDPNGLVYVDGMYHMFFQFLPHNLRGTSGNKFWGHAVSRDLVHWRQLPTAINPDKAGGIWSGSAAVDEFNTTGFKQGKRPPVVAMYTAAGGTSEISRGQPFTQCLAYSNDGGMTFIKYAHNPVLQQIVPGNRDPKIIWHAASRRWIMPLFLNASRGFALFDSPDLKQWRKLQELRFPQSQECPNFFPLPRQGQHGEDRWIFTGANSQYLIGRFDGRHFTVESGPFAMDTGNNFYAAQVYNNIPASDGRTIQIGWMRNGQYPHMPFNQQMSFPCALTLRSTPMGLRVCRQPVREIQHLWSKVHHVRNLELAGNIRKFPNIATHQLDIEAIIQPGTAKVVGMETGGQKIEFHRATGQIHCLGATGQIAKTVRPHEPVHLRVLVDRTSIEIFAQHGLVSMTSCYLPPSQPASFACYTIGGKANVRSLTVRELSSAWKR